MDVERRQFGLINKRMICIHKHCKTCVTTITFQLVYKCVTTITFIGNVYGHSMLNLVPYLVLCLCSVNCHGLPRHSM